jgi:hypothetical protein
MPFRLWYYSVRVLAPILFFAVALGLVLPRPWIVRFVFNPALYAIIALGSAGGIMGLLMVFGRLRMLCPFCGRYGVVFGTNTRGLWLECNDCGVIHGTGFLKLRLARRQDYQEHEADDDAED